MLRLVRDIPFEIVHVRRADRESTIAALPLKHRESRGFVFDPFGRLAFDFPNELSNREGFGEAAKDMHMILDTTHDQGRRFEVVTCPPQRGTREVFPGVSVL